jgi:UDP-glucose 4-epimerase
MRLDGSRVLVIGGAGFVGSYVVDELTQEPVREIVVLEKHHQRLIALRTHAEY